MAARTVGPRATRYPLPAGVDEHRVLHWKPSLRGQGRTHLHCSRGTTGFYPCPTAPVRTSVISVTHSLCDPARATKLPQYDSRQFRRQIPTRTQTRCAPRTLWVGIRSGFDRQLVIDWNHDDRERRARIVTDGWKMTADRVPSDHRV